MGTKALYPNGRTQVVTATRWIRIYLNGGAVPPGRTKSNIERLEEDVGREFLEKLADAGLSPQIWNVAERVMSYAGMDDALQASVLNWLLEHKMTRLVSGWISGGYSATELRNAFDQNREPKQSNGV